RDLGLSDADALPWLEGMGRSERRSKGTGLPQEVTRQRARVWQARIREWTGLPTEGLTVNDLRIEIKAGGRAKVDITVRNEQGGIVLTDQANLASIDGRRRTAKDLCGKLRDFGIEKTPPELEQELQTAWTEFAEVQEKEAAEQAKASNALEGQDPDSRERRRLEGMPADLLAEAEELVRSPHLMKRLVHGIASVGVAGERELHSIL